MLEQFLDNFTNSRVPTILFENVLVEMSVGATGFTGDTRLATYDTNEEVVKLHGELTDYIEKHAPVIAAPTLSITLGQDTNIEKVFLNFITKYDAVGFFYIDSGSGAPIPVRGRIAFDADSLRLNIEILTSD